MGNNEVRKFVCKEQRWSDKTAPKHKHNFSIEANVELSQPNGVFHFHVMKCEFCNSFRSIPKEGAITGFIEEPIADLPTIKLYKTHKMLGFEGAKLVESCD